LETSASPGGAREPEAHEGERGGHQHRALERVRDLAENVGFRGVDLVGTINPLFADILSKSRRDARLFQ
jgi:hypothetical protein